MAIKTRVIFRYKTEKGLLHKFPVIAKLLLLPALSILCLSLPIYMLGAGIIALSLFAFFCSFSVRDQLTDLKPVIFYAALMYTLSLFSAILDFFSAPQVSISLNTLAAALLIPKPVYLLAILRLILIVQLSALLFRSTSSIELRQGIGRIENLIRRCISHVPFLGKHISLQEKYSQSIALFLGFIPQVFETYRQLNLAWHARYGKNGLRKIRILVFALISLSMEKASVKANALAARSCSK